MRLNVIICMSMFFKFNMYFWYEYEVQDKHVIFKLITGTPMTITMITIYINNYNIIYIVLCML